MGAYTATRAVLLLLIVTSVTAAADSNKRRLHKFVSHFEPLHYDHGALMNEHHRVRRTVHGEKQIDLHFTALGRDFKLRLKPDTGEVFHDDAQLIKDGQEIPKTLAMSHLYTGVDLNDPTAKVYGHVAFGVFDGFIHSHSDIYAIEPADRFPHVDTSGAHSVIYRHSDLNMNELGQTSTCGAVDRGIQRRMVTDQVLDRVERQAPSCSQARNSLKVRCWLNIIADRNIYDTTTSGTESARLSQVMGIIATAIRGASIIYESTDFDSTVSMGPTTADNIQFGIEKFTVNLTVPSTSLFNNQFLGVEAYLRAHSMAFTQTYCLSYAFTSRDFDNGVLGLAFVASSSRQGGICSPFSNGQTLNTGVVTVTNFGQRVPSLVTTLTFAHEAGHNFGSGHDPSTAECAPSSGGNFIMFASASSGNQPNNRMFSPCSRRVMADILIADGQDTTCGCFREADDLCGNGIVDEGEECDCLSTNVDSVTMLCSTDACCNGTSCMVATGNQCSPQQGPCCNSSCQLISEIADFECRTDSDCALNQTCNGTSSACPESDPRVPVNGTDIPCQNGDSFCVNGGCTGTICLPLNLTDCECSQADLQCHICCIVSNGTCVSSIILTDEQPALRNLLPNEQGGVVRVGFPCSNFTGYCDFFNGCRIIDSDGALRRLANAIFSSEIFTNALQWITMYWWGVALMGVGIFVALFLVVLGCHFLLPRPEHMVRRAEERKKKRQQQRDAGLAEELPMEGARFRSL